MYYQVLSASGLADQIRGLVSEAVNNSGTCSAPTAPPSASLTFFFPHFSSSFSDSFSCNAPTALPCYPLTFLLHFLTLVPTVRFWKCSQFVCPGGSIIWSHWLYFLMLWTVQEPKIEHCMLKECWMDLSKMLHLVPFPVGKYKADRHRHGNQTCKESVKLRWLPDRQTDMVGSGQSNMLPELWIIQEPVLPSCQYHTYLHFSHWKVLYSLETRNLYIAPQWYIKVVCVYQIHQIQRNAYLKLILKTRPSVALVALLLIFNKLTSHLEFCLSDNLDFLIFLHICLF